MSLHEFDQFENNSELLSGILGEDKIDICIDDGLHTEESILSTFESVFPCLGDEFIYIVEDNAEVFVAINQLYQDKLNISNYGELTILTPKKV